MGDRARGASVKPPEPAEQRQRGEPRWGRTMLVTCPLPCEGSSAKHKPHQNPVLNQGLDRKKQNKFVC